MTKHSRRQATPSAQQSPDSQDLVHAAMHYKRSQFILLPAYPVLSQRDGTALREHLRRLGQAWTKLEAIEDQLAGRHSRQTMTWVCSKLSELSWRQGIVDSLCARRIKPARVRKVDEQALQTAQKKLGKQIALAQRRVGKVEADLEALAETLRADPRSWWQAIEQERRQRQAEVFDDVRLDPINRKQLSHLMDNCIGIRWEMQNNGDLYPGYLLSSKKSLSVYELLEARMPNLRVAMPTPAELATALAGDHASLTHPALLAVHLGEGTAPTARLVVDFHPLMAGDESGCPWRFHEILLTTRGDGLAVAVRALLPKKRSTSFGAGRQDDDRKQNDDDDESDNLGHFADANAGAGPEDLSLRQSDQPVRV